MSGSGRHVVYKDMEIGAWPNGLTLDHQERRIVWTDARYGKLKMQMKNYVLVQFTRSTEFKPRCFA